MPEGGVPSPDARPALAGYDVIGDVHGHADALNELLAAMDYVERNGVWSHRERQAIFVGDLIDRGPKQIESVRIARAMVDAGTAQIVLGNHEFNAVAYATPDGQRDYLRPHVGEDERCRKNREQHERFIAEVGFGTPEYCDMIEWFKTIPLWLDLGGLRVVHACWSSDHIDHLRPLVGVNDNLIDELVLTSSDSKHPSYVAVETILKGPEISLGDLHYLDKDGHVRDRARIRWWDESATSLATAAMVPGGTKIHDAACEPAALPDEPIAEVDQFRQDSAAPVIFGHYWWSADRGITSDRALCVDFSIAKEGELVAYRWDGEATLTESKIVRVLDSGAPETTRSAVRCVAVFADDVGDLVGRERPSFDRFARKALEARRQRSIISLGCTGCGHDRVSAHRAHPTTPNGNKLLSCRPDGAPTHGTAPDRPVQRRVRGARWTG